MNICLYGGAGENVPEVYIKSVYELGCAMGDRSMGLVFGGGITGMMGAAARGVRAHGGRLIGVAPAFFHTPGVLVEDCEELIITEDMRTRKQIMETRADGFIAAPGGIGTMDEFFEIITLCGLGRHKKPVALFNVNGYYDSILDFLRRAQKEGFVSASLFDSLGVFRETEPMLDFLEGK